MAAQPTVQHDPPAVDFAQAAAASQPASGEAADTTQNHQTPQPDVQTGPVTANPATAAPATAGPAETAAAPEAASGEGSGPVDAAETTQPDVQAGPVTAGPVAADPPETTVAPQAASTGAGEAGDTGATTPRVVRIARGVISSPALQGLTALAIYIAVLLATRLQPLLVHPSVMHLDLTGMDPDFFVWMLRWWPYAISHNLDPLRTAMLTAPGASALAWTSSVPALGVLAAPLTETMGPIVSFNLLTVLAPPLAGWAAFVLCRRLTRQFWPSLIGGAAFGFSAYQLGHSPAGQIDITYTLLLPIIGYLVLLWWEGAIGNIAFVALAGLAIAGQFYLFLETFAEMTALFGLSLVVAFLLAGRSYLGKVARLAGLSVAAYAVALLLAAPYLHVALTNVPNVLVIGRGLDLASVEIYSPLFAVAIALALVRWSSRLTWFLLVMLVFMIVIALGKTILIAGHSYGSLPWAGIWNLKFLRDAYPQRLMVFIYLDLAVMTAYFLAGPARKKWRRWARLLLEARWVLAGAIIASLVLDGASLRHVIPEQNKPGSAVPAFISSGQYRHVLSPGETVAVVSEVGNAGMLWQSDTNFYFRLVGGYVGAQFALRSDLPEQVEDLATSSRRTYAHLVRTFKAYVADAHVGAIIVEVNYEPWWVGIFPEMGLHGQLIGGVMVYRTHFYPVSRDGRDHHRVRHVTHRDVALQSGAAGGRASRSDTQVQ